MRLVRTHQSIDDVRVRAHVIRDGLKRANVFGQTRPAKRSPRAQIIGEFEELAALRRQQCDPLSDATRDELLALGHDVRRLWDYPKSPPEFKKRILRTVLKEIIASSDGDTVRLVLHWQGGDHTELALQKTRRGVHRYITDTDTIDLIRSLARMQPELNDSLDSQPHGSSYRARSKLEFQACVHNALSSRDRSLSRRRKGSSR